MMHVKLVRHLDDPVAVSDSGGDIREPVVPKENEIFEVERCNYKKVRTTANRFNETLNAGKSGAFVMGDSSDSFEHKGQQWVEYIDLWLYRTINDSQVRRIAAVGYSLFIMNDKGDTIDKLICTN